MKNCLIIGGGSKFGHVLTTEFLNAGYCVYLLTSSKQPEKSDVHEILIDWNTFNFGDLRRIIGQLPNLDTIFFNQNSSSLSANSFKRNSLQSLTTWQQSYFVSCQFPFYLIQFLDKKISTHTKIVWMLSQLIKNPVDAEVGFADYIGNKFTNACIMRAFSMQHDSCFFGLHPDGINQSDTIRNENKAKGIINLIDTYSVDILNGNIFSTNGERLELCNPID